jgi:hypothetical protein
MGYYTAHPAGNQVMGREKSVNIGKSGNFIASPAIAGVVEEIVGLLTPRQIYLYNQRINDKLATTSFKLCIIAEAEDKSAAERRIYLEIDCDIPFDILLYTPDEWETLTAIPTSFASKIRATGTVIYHG